MDTGAGIGDLGDSSGAEDAAIQQALGRAKAPATGKSSGAPPPSDGLHAHSIWSNALRGADPGRVEPNTPDQIALDRALANSLSRHMASGDLQAGVDAAGKAGSAEPPGFSSGPPPPKFNNPALAQHLGAGLPPLRVPGMDGSPFAKLLEELRTPATLWATMALRERQVAPTAVMVFHLCLRSRRPAPART